MNTVRRILKNFLSLLSAVIVSNLLGFVIIVYLARVLGPGDFGKINFAMAIVVYFTLIANLGLPLLGTREVARNRAKIKDYTGNILTLRLSLAFLGFGLLFLMAFFLNKPLEIKYLLILYGLGLIPSALLLDWAFQGVEKMEYIGLGRILATGIYLGLVLCFIKNPERLLLIPCFQVAGNLLVAGLLISIFLKSFGRPRLRIDLISWKSLLKQALPIGFSLIMVQIIFYLDTVMLGFMRSDEEVGYYNAAYKIILFLTAMLTAYWDTLFPVISRFYKMSLDSLKRVLQLSAKLMVTLALPLAVGGTILARPIMNLLYGTSYDAGIIGFKILIWTVAANCVLMPYGTGLLACDKQSTFSVIITIQAMTNLILNLILIPPLGLKGAAIATLFAQVIGLFLYYREFSKIVLVPLHNYFLKSLAASVTTAVFLYWGLNRIELSVFLLIPVGAFIYFILLYLTRGITKEDLKLLQSVF